MNSKLPLIFLCLAFGVLCGAAFAPSRIRWDWNRGSSVTWAGVNGSFVNIGLRDDGVVVWREITTATNVIVTTTNSPAEQESITYHGTLTNIIMPYYYWPQTNLWYHDNQWPTNNIWLNEIPVEVSRP